MQLAFTIITCILGTISMFIFFHTFFNERKTHISIWLMLSAFFLAQIATSIFPSYIHTESESMNTALLMIVSFLLTFSLTFFYSTTLKHRLFVSLCYHVITVLSELLIYVLFPASQTESLVSEQQQPNYLWNLISISISLFLIIVLCHIIRMHTQNYSIKYTAAVLITPVLSILSIIVVIDYSGYRFHSVYFYQIFLILSLYIMNAIHYFLFIFVIRSNQLASENQRLKEQITFQTNKYQQISTAYKNTRSMLHDTKQHFFYLDNCINTQNYAAMKEYLPTAIRKLEQSYNRINTGNLVIDAFVSNYLSIAANENIGFRTDIKINYHNIPVNDYDLCIILGNLLDNSLYAVRQIIPPRKREIFVHLFTREGNFVIHITNSYCPESTSEKEQLFHGYGCKNVEQITLKANGTYSHMIEHDTYIAIVSLPYDIKNG